MTTLLNLEYDLRPELSAYRRLLVQLFDAQADLRRTRVHQARADLWLSRALDDLAFHYDDLTAGEHLAALALGQSAAAAILEQAHRCRATHSGGRRAGSLARPGCL